MVCGPSGTGKGRTIKELREIRTDIRLPVSATTRPPRPGEIPGVSYHFLTEEKFDETIRNDEFLEHTRNGNGFRYGTLKSELAASMDSAPVLLEIDIEGARRVKGLYPHATVVFIRPPSLKTLRKRLEERDGKNDITEARYKTGKREMAALPQLIEDRVVTAVLTNHTGKSRETAITLAHIIGKKEGGSASSHAICLF